MPMSQEEISQLIAKLRARYQEYSQKFNPVWFNTKAFEERLLLAIDRRMDLGTFILAEVTNFEKIREKFEKRKKEKNRTSFSEKVDLYIEEVTARMKKYPGINFHPRAGLEIAHLYGAMSDFVQHYFSILPGLFKDPERRQDILDIEDRLEFLALPRGNSQSKRIEDHILLIARKNVRENEIERDRNDYLKECGFLLNEIADYCDELILIKNTDWETPLLFNKLFLQESRKHRMMEIFEGCTGYGAVLRVAERARDIISDFRLTEFRRKQSPS